MPWSSPALEKTMERRSPVGLPDQSHPRSRRRQMEPADHPRHDVRQPAAFPRAADESEEGIASNILADRLKRLVEQGIVTQAPTIRAKAEGDLQPDRAGHRAGAGPGADGGLGTQISAGDRGTRHSRAIAGGGRSEDVARLHGRTARDSSGCGLPARRQDLHAAPSWPSCRLPMKRSWPRSRVNHRPRRGGALAPNGQRQSRFRLRCPGPAASHPFFRRRSPRA